MVRFLLGTLLVAAVAAACGGPSLLQCRLDAVSRLPLAVVEDPDRLTLGDARELARGLNACRSAHGSTGSTLGSAPDGGP